MSLVPFYTPGWGETVGSKVCCLKKQHDAGTRPYATRLGLGLFLLLSQTQEEESVFSSTCEKRA